MPKLRSRWSSFTAITLLLCAMLAGTLIVSAGQKKGPAGSVFVSDKGKLNILLDGKSIGRGRI